MQLVRVRGLFRRPIRVGSVTVSNTSNKVLDLDDPKTRQALAHHSAIGQVFALGGIDYAIQTGVVTTAGAGLTVNVSAGTLVRDDTGQTITVAGATNQALTAADPTNPRIDLVTVNNNTGAVAVTAGTAAASPFPPAAPAGTTAIAQVRVNATATVPTSITDVAPRM